jgi:hypothetical protein
MNGHPKEAKSNSCDGMVRIDMTSGEREGCLYSRRSRGRAGGGVHRLLLQALVELVLRGRRDDTDRLVLEALDRGRQSDRE